MVIKICSAIEKEKHNKNRKLSEDRTQSMPPQKEHSVPTNHFKRAEISMKLLLILNKMST